MKAESPESDTDYAPPPNADEPPLQPSPSPVTFLQGILVDVSLDKNSQPSSLLVKSDLTECAGAVNRIIYEQEADMRAPVPKRQKVMYWDIAEDRPAFVDDLEQLPDYAEPLGLYWLDVQGRPFLTQEECDAPRGSSSQA